MLDDVLFNGPLFKEVTVLQRKAGDICLPENGLQLTYLAKLFPEAAGFLPELP